LGDRLSRVLLDLVHGLVQRPFRVGDGVDHLNGRTVVYGRFGALPSHSLTDVSSTISLSSGSRRVAGQLLLRLFFLFIVSILGVLKLEELISLQKLPHDVVWIDIADVITSLEWKRNVSRSLISAAYVGLVIDVYPPAPAHPSGAISSVVDLLQAFFPLNVSSLLSLVVISIHYPPSIFFE
jgi:hypothetical protein